MKLNKTQKEVMVRAIIADLKTEDFISQAQSLIQKDAISKLPEPLRAHLDYLSTQYVHVDGCRCMRVAVKNNNYRIPLAIQEQVTALHEKHVAQTDMVNQAKREIEALLHSCNTDKQAIQLLPENLHKYIPKEDVKENQSTALVSENLSNLINQIGLKS
jgi:hypothetical protein